MELQSKLEKPKLTAYFGQLSRMYSLSIIQIFTSISGLISIHLGLGWEWFVYPSLIVLNAVALIYYEPWKIMGALNEGLEYKRGMQTMEEMGIKKL
jgi:hypothetical protein